MVKKLLFGIGHEPPRYHPQTTMPQQSPSGDRPIRHRTHQRPTTRLDLTDCQRLNYCSRLYYCQPCQGHYNEHIHIISIIFKYLTNSCATGKIYGEENALQIYRDKEPGPLSGCSISNRQMAIRKITASNIRKLVAKYLSAHLTSQVSCRPPGRTSSKCSKEMSEYCLEKRASAFLTMHLTFA